MKVARRARIALTVVAALAAGGIAGAGVGLHWYGPAVAVAIALACGLAAGGVVLRAVLAAKRAPGPTAGTERRRPTAGP